MVDDGHGNFWFSSALGLFKVSKEELRKFAAGTLKKVTSVAYGEKDGMKTKAGNLGNQPVAWRTTGGQLLFTSMKGLVVVEHFLKDVKGRELVDAIRAVHAGQRPLPQEVASCLIDRIPCPELSPRELEILKLIANGESNKEIAVRLGIGEGTVRVHASNVFAKLGCGDRAQAVAVAFHRGIIAIE